MYPTLISVGPLSLASYGFMIALGFVFFAFSVWKYLRDKGIEDERIFDNLIVTSVFALIGGRILFVLTHWELFQKNILGIFLLWLYPGLMFWGGLLFALIALYFYAKKQKLPLGLVGDSYAKAFPLLMLFGSFAIFLDGTILGKETTSFMGMPAVGQVGSYHPVGLYSAVLATLGLLGFAIIDWKIPKKKIVDGIFGWITISFIGLSQLVLAFFRADLLYFNGFSIDYMIATIVWIMPLVPLFKLLHGDEKLHLLNQRIQSYYKNLRRILYDAITTRDSN